MASTQEEPLIIVTQDAKKDQRHERQQLKSCGSAFTQLIHKKCHPGEMGAAEVKTFLSFLATDQQVRVQQGRVDHRDGSLW